MKKVWKTSTCDLKFNAWIVQRDKRCVRCGSTQRLQASHYWNAFNSETRYDPENVDTLCYPCHFGNKKTGWEYNKQGEYRDFKLKQLGEEKYNLLSKKAHSTKPRKDAIKEFMEWFTKLL